MICQPGIFLFIPFKGFFLVSFKPALNILLFSFKIKSSLYHKKRGLMQNVLAVNRVEKAFAERKIMNCIQEIGLSLSIGTCEAIDAWNKLKLCTVVIFEINQR
jgi:hypothetical protein